MISWHKVGQKVVCVGVGWVDPFLEKHPPGWGPKNGEVATISGVHICSLFDRGTYFSLSEFSGGQLFNARSFRPVYPQIIDQLRHLDGDLPATGPARVKEDA